MTYYMADPNGAIVEQDANTTGLISMIETHQGKDWSQLKEEGYGIYSNIDGEMEKVEL